MTIQNEEDLPHWDTIHFLAAGVTYATKKDDPFGFGGRTSKRGDELKVTAELRAANSDRNGDCWLDQSEDEQLALHGRVLFRRGPWPDDADLYVRGSSEWQDAREAARKAAWSLQDPRARNEALAAVHSRFGAAPVTSRTFSGASADDERRANAEGSGDAYL